MSDIGTITEIEPEDGLGWIELPSGDRVRFGGTACKGFVPAVGMAVEVVGTRAGYGGTVKATELRKAGDAPAAAFAAPPGAAAPAAAGAPRTNKETLSGAGLRADDLLLAIVGCADTDDAFHADLEALGFNFQPQAASGVGCGNPWLYVVGMDGAGNVLGLYTHPLLPPEAPLPWVLFHPRAGTLRCVASDTSAFMQGVLASAGAAGVDPSVIARAHGKLVGLGMPDVKGQPRGAGTTAEWLPPEDSALRPLDQYLAETDGAEMERGLLAYSSRRQDARATEALRALYVAWEWTPPV